MLRRPFTRSLLPLAALALAAAILPAPAEAAGSWAHGVVYSGETGKFDGCFASRTDEDGSAIVLSWNRNGLSISVFDPGLAAGDGMDVALAVDKRWKRAGAGSAVGAHGLTLEIGRDDKALAALRQGNGLTAVAGDAIRSFGLKGSSAAIKRMLGCYETMTS